MLKVKAYVLPELNYFRELGKKFGFQTLPLILRSETCAILRAVMKKEKSASKTTLQERGSRQAFNKGTYPAGRKISINSGRRGGKKSLSWYRVDNKWFPVGIFDGDQSYSVNSSKIISDGIKDAFAQDFNANRRSAKERRKKFGDARGSTAQLYQSAMKKVAEPTDKVDTSASSYIQKARRLDNKNTMDLVSVNKRRIGNTNYSVRTEIDSVILSKNGAQWRLNQALANRQRYFQRAFRAGWVNDASFFAKTFNKIKVTK